MRSQISIFFGIPLSELASKVQKRVALSGVLALF